MKSDSASIDLASANTGYFEKRFFSLGCITIDCVCSTQFIRFYFHCSNLQKCWAGSCSTFALPGMNGTVAQYYYNINPSFLEPRQGLN